MAKHIVTCSICGKKFDESVEGAVKTSNTRYAHIGCAGSQDKIHKKMQEVLKEKYNKLKIEKQIKGLIKEGKNVDDILLTLEY